MTAIAVLRKSLIYNMKSLQESLFDKNLEQKDDMFIFGKYVELLDINTLMTFIPGFDLKKLRREAKRLGVEKYDLGNYGAFLYTYGSEKSIDNIKKDVLEILELFVRVMMTAKISSPIDSPDYNPNVLDDVCNYMKKFIDSNWKISGHKHTGMMKRLITFTCHYMNHYIKFEFTIK